MGEEDRRLGTEDWRPKRRGAEARRREERTEEHPTLNIRQPTPREGEKKTGDRNAEARRRGDAKGGGGETGTSNIQHRTFDIQRPRGGENCE